MITMLNINTDWRANICVLVAGAFSALVAFMIWQQQKKMQKEHARFERNAQVMRIKNLLVDIQFKADNFIFELNGIIKSLNVHNRNFMYQTIAQKYDQLGGLHNELIREKRLAVILNSNQECLDRLKDLDRMVQYMLETLYTLSYEIQNDNANPPKLLEKYRDLTLRLGSGNHPFDEEVIGKIILEVLKVGSPNPYITSYTFHEYLGARYLVFHEPTKSIFSLINKIVENK